MIISYFSLGMILIPGKSEFFIGKEFNLGEKWTFHRKWVQSRGKVNFLIGLISIHSGYFLVIYVSANILKCHFSTRNVNPIIFRIWDGKNSLFITQGTLQFPCASQFFPIHGLAVVVKKKSIIRGFAAHDGFFFHHAC